MKFLTREHLLFMHDALLEHYGGESGFLNESSLDSALAAPVNRRGYENAGLAACAASYAFHLTKAHSFVDGNKRLGAAAATAFIVVNGALLLANETELHDLILAIADGSMPRDQADAWFAARVRESPDDAAAP